MAGVDQIAAEEGLRVLGWREVPVDLDPAGAAARRVAPHFSQVFLAPDPDGPAKGASGDVLECLAYIVRKRVEHAVEHCYFPSLSTRTFVYKGMLSTDQLRRFFPDLGDERVRSALALVHSRFSTNTFPSWPLAHPYRYVAHNGEINTSPATGTGCAPGRRCSRPTASPAASSGSTRSSPRAAATRPRSTRRWSCSTWADARCRTPC